MSKVYRATYAQCFESSRPGGFIWSEDDEYVIWSEDEDDFNRAVNNLVQQSGRYRNIKVAVTDANWEERSL